MIEVRKLRKASAKADRGFSTMASDGERLASRAPPVDESNGTEPRLATLKKRSISSEVAMPLSRASARKMAPVPINMPNSRPKTAFKPFLG